MGVQWGLARQLEGVGANQRRHEVEGQQNSLQRQQGAIAIARGDADSLWQAAKAYRTEKSAFQRLQVCL